MLKEFVDRIAELAKASVRPAVTTHESMPHKAILSRPDGSVEVLDVPPAHRSAKLAGFTDLVAALSPEGMAALPEVYFDANMVFAYMDRHDRRDHASVGLSLSDHAKTVRDLVSGVDVTPRKARTLFLFDLPGCVSSSVSDALSQVDFSRFVKSGESAAHGRETLGRSVEAAVAQAERIPETFPIQFRVWSTSGFVEHEVTVACGVYLDVENSKIHLRLLAGEWAVAMNRAVSEVGDRLRSALPGVPVYHGAP